MGSWMKDLQERVRRASNDVNSALQPRMALAKRQIEEGLESLKGRGRELYADDARLAASLAALESVREHVRAVAASVDTQRGHLLAAAQTQRTLGETLGARAPADARPPPGGGRLEAATAFASAQLMVASATARFALDMSTPMADLARTFEERYAAKVSPLKKRHASTKAEYLKAARSAANEEDPIKRERLNALAQNAAPVAQRASEELQDEVRALLAYATSSLSEWTLNVAQAQAETYSRAAEAFKEPKHLAEQAQDASME